MYDLQTYIIRMFRLWSPLSFLQSPMTYVNFARILNIPLVGTTILLSLSLSNHRLLPRRLSFRSIRNRIIHLIPKWPPLRKGWSELHESEVIRAKTRDLQLLLRSYGLKVSVGNCTLTSVRENMASALYEPKKIFRDELVQRSLNKSPSCEKVRRNVLRVRYVEI